MAFSVSTSWLLPMNDRLHVRMGADLTGSEEESQARMDRLSGYLGTLPEYSIVEMLLKHPQAEGIVSLVGAVVYGERITGPVGSAHMPVIRLPLENIYVLDVRMASISPDALTDGVGFCIPARDVRQAVVRVVPDMAEVRTEADADRCASECRRAGDEAFDLAIALSAGMPDGSMIDIVAPAVFEDGGPVLGIPGILCDYVTYRAMVYQGEMQEILSVYPEDPGSEIVI